MTDIVKIAIIAAIPGTITSLALVVPMFRRLNHIAAGVNGIHTALKLEAQQAETKASETQSQLSRAEGFQAGSDSEREKK